MADQCLVSFEDVHATCGDVDISAITELKLLARANGVPQVTLLVDGGNSNGTGAFAADGVSLDNARAIFDTCRSMVKTSGASLSLSLTCRTVGGGGESQSLNLNGWMLVDAALSPVQQRGVCTAALTFAHPLYKAQLGGAMPGMLSVPPMLSSVSGGNPLEIFTAALEAYAEAPRSTPPQITVDGAVGLYEVEPALIRHLSAAVSALKSSVAWSGGGLPAHSVLGAWTSALWMGIASYGMPSAGNSVLQGLLSGLVPECSLALGGDFTAGALELGPFTPWADASLVIHDSDVLSLDFPQADPSPLSGVHFMTGLSSGNSLTSFHAMGAQAGEGVKPVDVFYVPQSELDAEYMYGPIQQFTEPGWLVHTASCAAGLRSRFESDSVTAGGGSFSSAATVPRGGTMALSGSTSSMPSVDYARAALLCAKAYFETSYMKDWAFNVATRLMFSSGGTLCPGRVVSIRSGSGEVVGGYINSVEHTISVANRAAVTRVTCTHPRFGGLPPAITSGSNALYT